MLIRGGYVKFLFSGEVLVRFFISFKIVVNRFCFVSKKLEDFVLGKVICLREKVYKYW